MERDALDWWVGDVLEYHDECSRLILFLYNTHIYIYTLYIYIYNIDIFVHIHVQIGMSTMHGM